MTDTASPITGPHLTPMFASGGQPALSPNTEPHPSPIFDTGPHPEPLRSNEADAADTPEWDSDEWAAMGSAAAEAAADGGTGVQVDGEPAAALDYERAPAWDAGVKSEPELARIARGLDSAADADHDHDHEPSGSHQLGPKAFSELENDDTDAFLRAVTGHLAPVVVTAQPVAVPGAFQFVNEARKRNLKPMVGCEFYLVEDRHRKTFSRHEGDNRYHQLMLAKNAQGYANLTKLCSLGYIDGLYSKFPRIDKELIAQYSEGLIATSCCIGAEIPQAILHGKLEEAEELLRWWVELLGEDF